MTTTHAPEDEQVFKCLVVVERSGTRRWRASATVSFNGRAVAASTARGTSKSIVLARASSQALEIAGRIPLYILAREI